MRAITRIAIATLVVASSHVQQASTPPSCAADLDSLAARIETDYAGARLELGGEKRAAYDRERATLRAEAARTTSEDCFAILTRLTDWFGDPHLFVFQSTRIDSADAARRAAAVQAIAIDESSARAYFDRHRDRLDPIEGIWYDGRLRVAVLPDSVRGPGRFVAVVLSPDTSAWPTGSVRARLARRSDGAYDVALSTRSFATLALRGELHKRVLLRLSPGIWGKAYPIDATDAGLLDPIDAHRATLVVRDGTPVLSIPSHDPAYRGALDTLLATNAALLRASDRLIIDLRGNEGGSSWVTNGVLPYLATARARATPYDTGRAVMLSSPDQIAYASRAFGPDTSTFVRHLLERLRAHPGDFVPLEDSATSRTNVPDSIVHGPSRVGVLIDRGTVSAAEVLVLDAMRSERARVFGEPTAGALDYQSVNVVRFASGERRWYLGYPTIAARASLPAGGMRGRGIRPDVVVDWRRVRDPIAFVEQALGGWKPGA